MWKRRKKPQKPRPQPDGFLSNIDKYARQVILYYNGAEHREFKRLIGEAADRLETTNQSDTLLCVLRTLALTPVVNAARLSVR
jgi:hypothetical protein